MILEAGLDCLGNACWSRRGGRMAAARLEAHHLGRWPRYVGSSPAGKRIMRCGAGFKPEAVDRATEGNASNMLPLDAEKAVPIRFGACLRSRGRGRVFRPEGMNGPPDCRERGERRGGSEKRMAGGDMSVRGDGELGCEAACLPDVEARGGFAADDTPAASLRTSLWRLPVR